MSDEFCHMKRFPFFGKDRDQDWLNVHPGREFAMNFHQLLQSVHPMIQAANALPIRP